MDSHHGGMGHSRRRRSGLLHRLEGFSGSCPLHQRQIQEGRVMASRLVLFFYSQRFKYWARAAAVHSMLSAPTAHQAAGRCPLHPAAQSTFNDINFLFIQLLCGFNSQGEPEVRKTKTEINNGLFVFVFFFVFKYLLIAVLWTVIHIWFTNEKPAFMWCCKGFQEGSKVCENDQMLSWRIIFSHLNSCSVKHRGKSCTVTQQKDSWFESQSRPPLS